MSNPVWIDAQLSPMLAVWVSETFAVSCKHVRELGLRNASDKEIFFEAKKSDAIVITKDSDFQELLHAYKSPPKIIWLTCGNTSNARVKEILTSRLMEAIEILKTNCDLVEVSD